MCQSVKIAIQPVFEYPQNKDAPVIHPGAPQALIRIFSNPLLQEITIWSRRLEFIQINCSVNAIWEISSLEQGINPNLLNRSHAQSRSKVKQGSHIDEIKVEDIRIFKQKAPVIGHEVGFRAFQRFSGEKSSRNSEKSSIPIFAPKSVSVR